MREFKFRAWDVTCEEMWTPFQPVQFEEDGYYKWEDINNDNCNIKLMQYTGLKDQNGTDIYEGDIVIKDDYETIIVSYGIQGVDAFEGIGFNLWSHYGEKQDGTRLQSELLIVGNIYENKDLIQSTE
jgi:uncharacterized phage protein (TIGR01671 family)